MHKRPVINVKMNSFDVMLEMTCLALLVGIWLLVGLNYPEMPSIIPTHFNAAGEADGFGSRSSVFMLPAISTVIYVGLTILIRFPHIYNYPVQITPENASRQYGHATKLIRWMKLGLILVFSSIAFQTIQISLGKANGLNSWFLPLSLAFLFVPLIISIIRMISDK